MHTIAVCNRKQLKEFQGYDKVLGWIAEVEEKSLGCPHQAWRKKYLKWET